jgi:glycosyltransferase 2 family protein
MRGRDLAVRALQLLLAAAVLWFAARELAPHWDELRASADAMRLRPARLLGSGLLVLASYAVLIETWRRTVLRWGHQLAAGTAARIWLVSNLGRYLPGKIWQITAMGTMAREAGVPATAAVGSSLLIAVVNVLAGGAVVLATAFDAGLIPPAVALGGAGLCAALALLPPLLPRLAGVLGRWRGREVVWPALRLADLMLVFAGCAAAWALYGIAFEWLALGTQPDASGATRYYIASFTVSYLAGFLALVAPGGVGVREVGLLTVLPALGLTSTAGAALLALTSRLWLTLFELLPGLVLLLVPGAAPSRPTVDDR